MENAEQQVPGKRHHETPLYLGATAGMRLLKYGRQLYTHPHNKMKNMHSQLRKSLYANTSLNELYAWSL